MKCLLSILALCIVSTLASPPEISEGFFPGRSDNVIFRSTEHEVPAGFVSIYDESGKFVSTKAPEQLRLSSVADIISESLGVIPPHKVHDNGLIKQSAFERPRANVLVTIDGATGNLAPQGSRVQSHIDAKSVSYPYNSLSAATTLASGRQPETHGVVGSQWTTPAGHRIHAYESSSQESGSLVSSVAEVLDQSFDGKAFIVSASADQQLSKAFAPKGGLKLSMRFDGVFGGLTSNSPLDVNAQDLYSSWFASENLWNTLEQETDLNFRFSGNKESVTVLAPGLEGTTFDLKDMTSFSLFAELSYLHSLPNRVATSQADLVEDDVPDLYCLTIASLKAVLVEFGAESPEYACASRIVQASLAQIVKGFSALYPQRVVVEVVTLQTDVKSMGTEQQQRSFLQSVNGVLIQNGLSPVNVIRTSLHVNADLDTICTKLAASLAAEGAYEVFCPSLDLTIEEQATSLIQFQVQATPTQISIERYQIILWLSILLAFVLLASAYGIAYMDMKKDTLLYSKFNPNWESKK